VALPGGSCDGAVGGSFGGDVALPSVAGGVTAADCKTGSAATAGGSRGGDVTLPVTVADCKTGSVATCGGSCGDDVTLPVTPVDCKTGSAATCGRKQVGRHQKNPRRSRKAER
jgi:hypothetical protein